MEARAGIVVEASDSVTGVPITRGYTIVVADGTYRETIVIPPEGPPPDPAAAREREGTYTVTVQTDGYTEWSRMGVRVDEEGECHHVRTVTVVARLKPE